MLLEGPFSPDKLAAPLHERVRLEEENDLARASTRTGSHRREFAGEDDTREFVPARVGVHAPQNAELLAQKQGLESSVTRHYPP